MARFNLINNSFISGEISPRARGRTDIQSYAGACNKLENLIVHPQGGASRRPGSQFVKKTHASIDEDGSLRARLIPFIFSESEKYLVEITATGGFTTQFQVINVETGLRAEVNVFASSLPTGTPGTYTEDEFDEIQYAQNGDRLFLTHPNHGPLILSRFQQDKFTLENLDLVGTSGEANHFPFQDRNSTTTTLALSGGTALTASAPFFKLEDVGSIFLLNSLTETAACYVTAVSHSLAASVTVMTVSYFNAAGNQLTSSVTDIAATLDWHESYWSNKNGWPRTVCFFQGRTIFGGSEQFPDTVWGSQTFDFTEFRARRSIQDAAPTSILITDPFAFTISSGEPNEIQWLSASTSLQIGTRGREYTVTTQGVSATPNDNINVKPETSHGSSFIQAVRVANAATFIENSGQKIREFIFNDEENSFVSNDVLLLSEHFPRKSLEDHDDFNRPYITAIQFQGSPDNVIWCLDSNGGFWGVTRDRQQRIIAAHNHKLGGLLGTEPPKVISIAALPSVDGTHDDIYLCVKRTVGSDQFFIERIGREFDLFDIFNSSQDIQDKAAYSDSGDSQFITTPGTTFSGWGHLVGEVVEVLADGQYVGEKTVQAGDQYITNSDIEVDASGYTAFNDVATVSSYSTVTDTVTTTAAHGFVTGDLIVYETTGTEQGGIVNNQIYQAVVTSPTEFKLLLNAVDAFPVDITAPAGTGTETFFSLKPVDGTGGSSVFTVTRNTVSPINGTGDLKISVGAFESGGHGVSIPVTIPAQTQGKPVDVSFDFDATHVGYSGGFSVFLYNVDSGRNESRLYGNAALPASTGTHNSTFTTTRGDDNYRLVFYDTNQFSAVAFDIFLDDITVSSQGKIVLSNNAQECIAGLKYVSTLETCEIDGGSVLGSSQGRIKRIDECVIRFNRTINAQFGPNEDDLLRIEFRPPDLPTNDPIPLFTGDKVVRFQSGYDRNARVVVIQDRPFPMEVVSVISRGETHE